MLIVISRQNWIKMCLFQSIAATMRKEQISQSIERISQLMEKNQSMEKDQSKRDHQPIEKDQSNAV